MERTRQGIAISRPGVFERRSSRAGFGHILERCTFAASVEQVVFLASVFWALAANRRFVGVALAGRSVQDPAAWVYAVALVVLLVGVHMFLLSLVASRITVKPLLSVLFVATAVATYFMQRYGVILDPSMVRNVLNTDVGEGRELITWALVPHLTLYAVVPLALLWRVRLLRRPRGHALAVRAGVLLVAGLASVGALVAVFQPFASLMRNHKEARYLITPANIVWSLGRVAASDARGAGALRRPIGLDAAPGPSWASLERPRVVVVVVGETARAANWQLSGYARATTPRLAQLPVVNFAHVAACGTSTEVSLPCMFAPVGRRHYDEARIRGSESLLHVASRVGVGVHWLDNQSGCKGVCDGLPSESASFRDDPVLCDGHRCLDEVLVKGLGERLDHAAGVQLIVLHMLGNHGPAYHRRYPQAFARFRPACEDDDLQHCTQAEIVNAYDNALSYTDHVLATLIEALQARASQVDAAMVYVSDHGESLGENNLYLHGLPHALAPATQTAVPMVMWMSPGFASLGGPDAGCLRDRASQPVSHDHLFHTVLGLLDVRTALYEPAWDIAAPCRLPVVSSVSR